MSISLLIAFLDQLRLDLEKKIKNPTPVVIEFYARWCSASRKINPAFDRCSERLQYDGLGFYRIDIDNEPDITQVANVQKIPFFVVYKQGKRLGSVEGADNRALATLLENHS